MNPAVTAATPRHRRVELTHIDGLDGLRGLAVIAVILYHGDLSWSTGGFLGVELFFVLSGFLITSLLVREWLSSGTIVLADFWARRARRLLPALFVLVVVIGIYYAFRGTVGSIPGLFGDGLAALFYYSNWHQIAQGSDYFLQQGPTSPFQHTWSLAIEEQFYLVWPLLFLCGAWVVRRSVSRSAGVPSEAAALRLLNLLLGLSLVLLVASAADCALLYHANDVNSQNRVYMGTDTRAYGLLSGAALAILMARLRLVGRGPAGGFETGGTEAAATPGPARRTAARRWTPVISVGSLLAVIGLLVLMWRVSGDDAWLYPWGFLVCDGLGVALVAVILTTPRSVANRLFSVRPLRWVGKISYGLYLWHFPLFLWLDQSATGLSGFPLLALRIVSAVAVAVLSYHLVEQPVRQRRWPVWITRGLAPVTAGAGVVSLALAASAAAIPTVPPPPMPPAAAGLAGTDPACAVTLTNTKQTGAVAPTAAQEQSFEIHSLDAGTVTWPTATAQKVFTTCPPERMMFVGDSIAFSLALPMLVDEQKYGSAVSDAAILGCAFSDKGQLDVNGTWQKPPANCGSELGSWSSQANRFGAQELIFELGYRDEFNWRWGGRVYHLGMKKFDDYVLSRMKAAIRLLGDDGRRKVLFLSVPYVHPAAEADGSPAPQSLRSRHTEINKLLKQAAASDGANASVMNVDTYLSPKGHYTDTVNGQECRLGDGIHPSQYCSELLEPYIFLAGRHLLGS